MEFLGEILRQTDVFLLIFGRVLGFLLLAVPFSNRSVPAQVKVGFAALLSFLLLSVHPGGARVASGLAGYLVQLAGEVGVGLVLGFLTQLAFSALQLAGQLIDMQMGFGIVNVIDPQYGTQVPVVGNFKYALALLFFLAVDGHHTLLRALASSYQALPLGPPVLTGPFYAHVFSAAGMMFVNAFKIALPVVGALYIADFALGIIARTVPQMNVFVVGMPLKVGVGIGFLLILLPLYLWVFGVLVDGLFHDLARVLVLLRRS